LSANVVVALHLFSSLAVLQANDRVCVIDFFNTFRATTASRRHCRLIAPLAQLMGASDRGTK
jgi:hypothetical protein